MQCNMYLHRQTFPAIVDGAPEHLVPHELHIGGLLPLNEAAQVMLDNVAGWLSSN